LYTRGRSGNIQFHRKSSETEPLVFIDFDVKASKTDIVTFPDMSKMMIFGTHVKATVDIPEK
jgi:hypothetical protein